MGEREVDQALVERVQQGDKRAFDILVQKYQHRVMKLIARFVRNADDVQDVAQETAALPLRNGKGQPGERVHRLPHFSCDDAQGQVRRRGSEDVPAVKGGTDGVLPVQGVGQRIGFESLG